MTDIAANQITNNNTYMSTLVVPYNNSKCTVEGIVTPDPRIAEFLTKALKIKVVTLSHLHDLIWVSREKFDESKTSWRTVVNTVNYLTPRCMKSVESGKYDFLKKLYQTVEYYGLEIEGYNN